MQHALVDIGVNLTNKAFRSDRQAVLDRAKSAGVEMIVITGTTVPESQAAAELAATQPNWLYATAGLHPHHASDWNVDCATAILALSQSPQVVAMGECGLDFNRNFSTPEQQLTCLEAQLELAAQTQLPVFLHERDASDALLSILQRHRPKLQAAVVHCFTGSAEALRAYLDLDLYIGITGWVCDERRGKPLQELLPQIPLDRLLLESDAPYLIPRSIRPKPKSGRNEPAYLVHVLATVAECLGLPAEEVAAKTTQNAKTFFGLAESD